MLQKERHGIIINHLNLHHKVTTTKLCKMLKVSLDTVRRDLAELQRDGKIVKVHGGAMSKSFNIPFQPKEVYAKEEKKEIARKALGLIKDGMIILCGGGTIMLELARIISKDLKATFFTVSPLVALELTERSTANVMLVGGQLSRNAYICTGSQVISQLSEIKADLCLLGANALSVKDGATEYDWEITQVKKALIKSASNSAILSISEKLDASQKMQVCPLSSIDYLITELKPTDKRVLKYSRVGKIL
jgi:DeoR/GlpR family transcriptional regulator of sugar metabolism